MTAKRDSPTVADRPAGAEGRAARGEPSEPGTVTVGRPAGAGEPGGVAAPGYKIVEQELAFADTAPDSSPLDEPAPGDLLAGKYRIERDLASGGMGQVVIAHHLELGRRVAVKLLHPRFVRNRSTIERFRREARAVAKLKSPHIVRVFDIDERSDGMPFIVMEYLEGDPLNVVIRRDAPLPIEEAVGLMTQALAGLAEAHDAGVIHRDLKPHNLFVTHHVDGRPLVKILDFGISKFSEDVRAEQDERALTDANDVLGTPIYMSPEQVQSSRDVDARTDIWSMGIILRELLTAERLFEAASPSLVFARILRDPIPPARSLRPDVPEAIEALMQKCLARDRAHRFASAGEMAAALAPFTGRARGPSTPVRAEHLPAPKGAAAPRPKASSGAEPVSEPSRPTPSKRPAWHSVVLGAVVVGALATAAWLLREGDPSTRTTPSATPATPASLSAPDPDPLGRAAPTLGPEPLVAPASAAPAPPPRRPPPRRSGASSAVDPAAPSTAPPAASGGRDDDLELGSRR